MKLPENLAKRYTMMTDAEMEGSGQAKDLVKAAMLRHGGRPGATKMEDSEITKAVLRPGVISWDDKKDAGVWFDVDKAGGSKVGSASHLNLDKLLHSRYVNQKVQQGQDVREFPGKGASTPVQKEKDKMVAQVKAEAAQKVAAVKEAAKVEAKAKALADKAKATKEAALSGLAGLGLGYLGDQAALDAAGQELAQAQEAAFAIGTCVQGGVPLPAHVCDPSLMDRFVKAQENLAKLAEQHGNEEAAAQAAAAAAQAAASQQTGSLKLIVGVLAIALVGIVIYLVKKG